MDLTPFGAKTLVAVRVRERTIAGSMPGVVVRYVLELEWSDRPPTLLEQTVPEDQAFNLASFEAFIRDLNKALAKRHGQP